MFPFTRVLLGSAIAIGLYGGATMVGVAFENRDPGHASGSAGDLIFLPTPQQARLMSLGYATLVADYYWVKSLQYYMDPNQTQNRYKNLADFLEVVVGVDPDYEYAYKFAGLSIPFDTGRFHHVNTLRSTRFLERGVARFPQNWQLRFLLAYNYLNYHHQPSKAAVQLEAAAALPGSPTYLKAFAARVYAVGGELDRALEFAKGLAQTSTDPETKQMMEARVTELQVEKELRRIEASARAFKEQKGTFPTLEELIASGFEKPPAGYSLDPTGVAKSELNTQRMILYEDPNQKGFGGE